MARAVAALGVALTPLVLAACYGAPPCEPDELVDADGDGFDATLAYCWIDAEDCDDADPAVNPGAAEVACNEVDDDCDGFVDSAEICGNALDDDCDGETDEVEAETCDDGQDNDCDGAVDFGDTDCSEPAATGSLSISYVFQSVDSPASCAEAAVSELAVTLTPASGAAVSLTYACDDTDLDVADLPEGAWTVAVTGDVATGALYANEPVSVDVRADETVPVPITLVCDENGVDDGCGGA